MPSAGVTHDLVLEDYDSRHRRGFMYARNKMGRRPFDTREAQPIAPRQLTMGELTQSEDPPTIALNWFQDSWIKGIGGKNFRVPGCRKTGASWRLPRRLRPTPTAPCDLVGR